MIVIMILIIIIIMMMMMISTTLNLGTNNLITAQLQRRLSDIAATQAGLNIKQTIVDIFIYSYIQGFTFE